MASWVKMGGRINFDGLNIIYTSSPNIVKNNLIYHVDAGNNQSYSGSGSTWFDLVGNYDTTIIGSPTHTTESSTHGFFTTGVGQSFTVLADGSGSGFDTSEYTIEVWFQNLFDPDDFRTILWSAMEQHPAEPIYTQHLRTGGIGSAEDELAFQWNSGGGSGIISADGALTGTQTDWHHAVGVMNSAGPRILYLDSVSVASDTGAITVVYPAKPVYIGRDSDTEFLYSNAKYSIIRFYDRALTGTEILQNFNAQKERFGY